MEEKYEDEIEREKRANRLREQRSKTRRVRRRRRRPVERSADDVTPGADPRTDTVAREAARLFESGLANTIHEAVLTAVRRLDAWDAPRPSRGRVREHARSMAMEELGESGYVESIRDVWRLAEEVMTVLEHAIPTAETELVGRVARGLIDAGVVIHIRIYTDEPIGDIAQALVDHDYEEPDFETLATDVGLLDELRFFDDEGEEIAVLRVPKSKSEERRRDLVTGKRTDRLDLDALRERIESDE